MGRRRTKPSAAGSNVSAAMIEMATAIEMVSARSPNSCPSTSLRNSTGTNTAIVVALEASRAPATCRAPFRQASLAQAYDVPGDDDRPLDHHADGERETREGDHIETAAKEIEHHEGREQ